MIQIESISPESYAKQNGLCIGVGGLGCPARCCNPDGPKAGFRKQKSSRGRAKKSWTRTGKKFWFED